MEQADGGQLVNISATPHSSSTPFHVSHIPLRTVSSNLSRGLDGAPHLRHGYIIQP